MTRSRSEKLTIRIRIALINRSRYKKPFNAPRCSSVKSIDREKSTELPDVWVNFSEYESEYIGGSWNMLNSGEIRASFSHLSQMFSRRERQLDIGSNLDTECNINDITRWENSRFQICNVSPFLRFSFLFHILCPSSFFMFPLYCKFATVSFHFLFWYKTACNVFDKYAM